MRKVNITFQVGKNAHWDKTPIVYVMENVPENTDVENVCHVLSVINNFATIRSARLFLHDPITPYQACRQSGSYYQAQPYKFVPPLPIEAIPSKDHFGITAEKFLTKALGIEFSSNIMDIHAQRLTDLFYIAWVEMFPDKDCPNNKAIADTLKSYGITKVEIVHQLPDKMTLRAKFKEYPINYKFK